MGAIRYSCPIRLVPTYILLIKNIYTLWGRKRLRHCVAELTEVIILADGITRKEVNFGKT